MTALGIELAVGFDLSRITRYGMDPKLGHVSLEESRPAFPGGAPRATWREREYSEDTAREIDCAIREIVERAFKRAVALLQSNRDLLERSARLLLQKETLSELELQNLRPALRVAA